MVISGVSQNQTAISSTSDAGSLQSGSDAASEFESAMANVKAADGIKPGFDVTQEFKQQLKDLAKNENEFYQLLDTVFGPGVDRGAASRLRTQVLNNDFSFLPEHQFADGGLGTANGVFDETGDRIVLRSDLDLQSASKTYTEEAFHSLENDLLGKNVEAAGDEGAIGLALLNETELSPEQLAALRNEDDFRNVTIDGKTVRVEAQEGDDDPDAEDFSDMDAEDVSANPGDQQDGIGQSPGEDISGLTGGDDGGLAQTTPVGRAIAARDAARQAAIDAINGNLHGAHPSTVQSNANTASQQAEFAQQAANEAKDAFGANSPEAKDAQDAADIAAADAEMAQDAAENANSGPGEPIAALSNPTAEVLTNRAIDAGIAEGEAKGLVADIQNAKTWGERQEALGAYQETIDAQPAEELSDEVVAKLRRRAAADDFPQNRAEELIAAIRDAETRGEQNEAYAEYLNAIRTHRNSADNPDGEAE